MIGWIKSLYPPQKGAFSICGHKSRQEDAWYMSPRHKGNGIVLVADGVGGHNRGDIASKLCADIFKQDFENAQFINNTKDFIHKTIIKIAATLLNAVSKNTYLKGSGTTVSGFFYKDKLFYTFNVGDSRVYYLSKGKLTQVTKDHSLVQSLIDKGEITETEALHHPHRNIMTSALGQALDQITIDIKGPYKLKKNDVLMACSDGLHTALSDNEIRKLLGAQKNMEILSKNIVEKAFQAGSKDNITACIYRHR